MREAGVKEGLKLILAVRTEVLLRQGVARMNKAGFWVVEQI
jgi:hypothetical protein